MGKKKETLRNDFSESIDPRFCGIFNSAKSSDSTNSKTLEPVKKSSTEPNNLKANENIGFQSFISKKLSEFLDSHMKEVDRPVSNLSFYSNRQGSIKLFSDCDAITEERVTESYEKKPPKKKKKKDRKDEELLKDVAVSVEFLQRQSQLFNS